MADSVNVDVSRTRKEALFETLSGILSPSQDVRACAEEQIKALEVTDGKFYIKSIFKFP